LTRFRDANRYSLRSNRDRTTSRIYRADRPRIPVRGVAAQLRSSGGLLRCAPSAQDDVWPIYYLIGVNAPTQFRTQTFNEIEGVT